MAGASLIFFVPGAQAWQRFELPVAQSGLTMNIGRNPHNELVLDDPGVAEYHAALLVDPQGIYILDRDTVNGIQINGRSIPPNQWVLLATGDALTMGNSSIRMEGLAAASTASVQIAPPQPIPNFQVQAAPAKKRPTAALFVVGGILCLLAVSALLLWFKGDSLAGLFSGSSAITMRVTDQSVTLNADGQPMTDANGVTITLPVGALEGEAAELTSAALPDELKDELSKGYDLISPAYALNAQGATDGAEPGQLSFPAQDEDLRLLAVIDGIYVAELAVAPESGNLTIPADIHPSDFGELDGSGGMWKEGSIQYVLVRPKSGSPASLPSEKKIAAPLQQTTPDPCFSLTRSRCWQNGNGSVQLMMSKDVSLTPSQSYVVINYIQGIMDKYEALGFDGAIYTASNPVQVVVEKGSGTPLYQVANGVIYLPNDIAIKIAGGGKDSFLIHEMAHWIQDENYYFTKAYIVQADTWWIDTSAENMVMLIDSSQVATNLLVYGELDADATSSVFQLSPYQWPMKEFYLQAQILKVNLCDGGTCALSTAKFIEAINEGSYPFRDESARAALHANLGDYARYLLGVAPLTANSTIPLDGVMTGEGYGDHITIKQSTKSVFDTNDFAGDPRMEDVINNTLPMTNIQATLQKDGVYVLRVDTALGSGGSPWPASMRIEAGTPYYYRINDGEIQYNDGTSELMIQPIMSGASGKEINKVRVVAVGMQGGEVFKAHVGAMDLSGMWVLDTSDESSWINNLSCEDQSLSDFVMKDGIAYQINLPLMFGDFTPDLDSQTLTWTAVPSRLNPLLSAPGVSSASDGSTSTYSGVATVFPDGIELNLASSSSPPTTFNVDPSAYSTQFISVRGSMSAEVTFDKISYLGTEDGTMTGAFPNVLTWRLTGDYVTYTYNVYLLNQQVNRQAVVKEETRVKCTGTAMMPASLSIYQPKK